MPHRIGPSAQPGKKLRDALPITVLSSLILLSVAGCDRKEETTQSDVPNTAEEKQERLEALLKQNGLDPNTLPMAGESKAAPAPTPPPVQEGQASPTPSQPVAPPNQPPTAADVNSVPGNAQAAKAPPVAIQLLSRGTPPYRELRYNFKKDEKKNFNLTVEVGVDRQVGGQAVPTMPPFSLALGGTTTTVQADDNYARRLHTFMELIPRVEGVPAEVAAQLSEQYSGLKGLQLLETVSTRGVMMGMELDERAVHPQVLALMQHLQDGMTNSFLPLPEPGVGVGARWVGTTTIDAAGIGLIQENEITIKSLQGSKAEVSIKLRQHAKSAGINPGNLPPGVSIELVKLEGGGQGNMTVDFDKVTVESTVTIKTSLETAITQPGTPAPIKEAANTSMKATISIRD